MLQHNPYSHNVLCPALAESLEPFSTRKLDSDQAKLVKGCASCSCRLIDVNDGAKAAKAPADDGE